MSQRTVPYPFLKWAGGKSRMLGHILSHMPDKIDYYYEPFLGGGAVFFELARGKRFRRAVLGDMNPDLMNAYREVRNRVDLVIADLRSGQFKYDKDTFLEVRAMEVCNMSPSARAARFIFLNRTCFNGLYRVNKDGRFNVPFGRYDNPLICDEDNLRAVSSVLKKSKLMERDFSHVVKTAKPGDVVYFDPPYFPLSETAKFVSYTKGGFGLAEHTQLAVTFAHLAEKGATVILSNSWCPTTLRLFRDYEIVELTGSRNVGGPAEYRKPVREIMVVANGPALANAARVGT